MFSLAQAHLAEFKNFRHSYSRIMDKGGGVSKLSYDSKTLFEVLCNNSDTTCSWEVPECSPVVFVSSV